MKRTLQPQPHLQTAHPAQHSRQPLSHSSPHIAPPPPPLHPPTDDDGNLPPSYDHAQEQRHTNPRFPRWGSWIEKRARERTPHSSSSWNLEPPPASSSSDSDAHRSRSTSAASSAASTGGGGADAVHHLTDHTQILRVGARFAQGIPGEPLCAVALPTGRTATQVGGDERLVLIGTADGLYLLDTQPWSASTPLSTSVAPADAQIHRLWSGVGIHHLELHFEPPDSRADSPKGLVLGLVDVGAGELAVRMWSLVNLVSLAKWRVFNENSVPLSLRPPSASDSSVDRRSSLAFLKTPRSPASRSPTNGKHLALPASASSQALVRQASTDAGHLLVDSPTAAYAGDSAATSLSRLSLNLDDHPSQPASSLSSRLELPLAWATSSVPLPTPKSGGAVLFFRLFRMPDPLDLEDDDEDDDEYDENTPRRREREAERRRLFLFVATTRSIFLFESKPTEKRTWVQTKELFAPSTPRFLRLVRTPLPAGATHRTTAQHPYPPDLHLLLGTSHRLVLISLLTSSVHELALPASPRTRSTSVGSSPSAPVAPSASAAPFQPTHRHSTSAAGRARSAVAAFTSAASARVAALRAGPVPAGMSGLEPAGLVPGRRVDGAAPAGAVPEKGRWTGCELSGGAYLLTRGSATYIVPSLPAPPSVGDDSAPLQLDVRDTVQWHPLPHVARVVTLAGGRALAAFGASGVSVVEEGARGDGDGESAATLDYARPTHCLAVLPGSGGALFAVEARGEWVLKRLVEVVVK